MPNIFAVGIDLGTTNSAAACVTEAGQTSVLANPWGELTTPSAVYFDENDVVVGRDARKAIQIDPGGVAERVKRDVGHEFYSKPLHGKSLPPEVIQGCILAHMKELIEQQLAGDYEVVITVPAFFDERRRKSVEQAGQIAGLKILDIVNEPTAAALAFAEHHGYLTAAGSTQKEMTLLVYDLGGGTFDATVIRLSPGKTETLATDGDVRLGGYDWDHRLAAYAAQKFEGQFRVDPRDDATVMARLTHLAEEAKHTLSTRQKAVIPVHFQRLRRDVEITREQFEVLTSDLLERTLHTSGEVIEDAGLDWSRINKVLLAGGATRMPMVPSKLEVLSGRVPDRSVSPDESVARGAAIYASFRLAQRGNAGHPLRFQVIDVNSHSLGIEGVDPITGRRENTIVIPRNTPLPATAIHRFVTRKPNQDSVRIKILEGESLDPRECITIGRAVMREIPPGIPKGHPIEVIYAYEANGRLQVQLRLPHTKRVMTMELQREGSFDDDRIHRWKSIVSADAGFPSFVEIVEQVLGVRVDVVAEDTEEWDDLPG